MMIRSKMTHFLHSFENIFAGKKLTKICLRVFLQFSFENVPLIAINFLNFNVLIVLIKKKFIY